MIKHFFSELLGFFGVFFLLGIMTVGFIVVAPFVMLHYLAHKFKL